MFGGSPFVTIFFVPFLGLNKCFNAITSVLKKATLRHFLEALFICCTFVLFLFIEAFIDYVFSKILCLYTEMKLTTFIWWISKSPSRNSPRNLPRNNFRYILEDFYPPLYGYSDQSESEAEIDIIECET